MIQLDRIASREASHHGRGGRLRMLFVAAVAVLPVLLAGCATQIEYGLQPVKVTETSGCSLCSAAYQGDLARVTYLLQHGANPNATYNGRAPILFAILSRSGVRWDMRWDIVLMLLHYHANPNAVIRGYHWNVTPIIFAAEPDGTPESDASDVRAVDALIKAGADVNIQTSDGDTALIWASRLMWAAPRASPTIVADLLRANANPNIRNVSGNNALDCVVANLARTRSLQGSIRTIRMLLAAGTKPDSALEQLAFVMRDGLAANGAVPRGTKRALRLLLAYGAKPQNVRDPLLLSVIGDRPDLARMLINAGDPVDLLDKDGRTALNLAVKADNIEQAKMLLDFGSGGNGVQYDPLAQAYKNNDLAMVRLLVQRDAYVQNVFVLDWPPKRSELPKMPQLASFYLKSERPFANINRLLSNHDPKRAMSVPDVLSMLRSYEMEPIPALRRSIFLPVMGREGLMPAPPEAARRYAAAGNTLWAHARSRTDAILAADQYELAANLAPWIPAYQRNLCLLEYAAGEYERAANDCEVYREAFSADLTVSGISAKLKSMKNI